MTTREYNVTSSGEMKKTSTSSARINSNDNIAKEGEGKMRGLLSNKDNTVEERQCPRESTTSPGIMEPVIHPSENIGPETESTKLTRTSRSQWFTITILCYINLVRCMDQFNLAGKIKVFELHFQISKFVINLLKSPTCVKP